MDGRFYIDPVTGEPHIYGHGVSEDEVVDVLDDPIEDRPAQNGARSAIGQSSGGRYLRVIYVSDPKPGGVFVIPAYPLSGAPLAAYRRLRRGRGMR